jgi:hypothetical protein
VAWLVAPLQPDQTATGWALPAAKALAEDVVQRSVDVLLDRRIHGRLGACFLIRRQEVLVVVRDVVCQHRLEMWSTDDQHAVQQLMTDCADPSLSHRVRARRPRGRPQSPDALGSEDGIEGVGELRVPVTKQKPELPHVVCQIHEQVAGLLGHPRPGRVGGDAQDVDAAGGKLDHEQHIQPPEQHRVDMEQVARQDPLGLDGQELSPGQPRAAWRWIDACPVKEQPHRAWREPVTKPGELTVDTPIPPGRVLGCQPQDQVPQPRRDRRSTGRAVGLSPVALEQLPMPAQ